MLTVKKGDTLSFVLEWEGATLEALKAQVRDDFDRLIADFAIYEYGEGKFLFMCDTSNFPISTLYFDIQRSYESTIVSTNTVKLKVVKDVTR